MMSTLLVNYFTKLSTQQVIIHIRYVHSVVLHYYHFWLKIGYKSECNQKLATFYIRSFASLQKKFQVFDALIQFEREVGTIEELDKALEKVNAQAIRISSRPQKDKMEKSKKRKRENDEDVQAKKTKMKVKRELIVNEDEFVNGATETAAQIQPNREVFFRRKFCCALLF